MITLESQSIQHSKVVLLIVALIFCFTAPMVSLAKEIAGSSLELTGPGGLSFLYDPFSGQAGDQSIELAIEALLSSQPSTRDATTVSSSSIANQWFNLRIRPAGSKQFDLVSDNGTKLPLEVSSSAKQRLSFQNGHYIDFINFSNQQEGTLKLSYKFSIKPSVWAAPGSYKKLVLVELVNANNPEEIMVTKTLDIVATVEPKLQTNLAGQIGSFDNGVDVAIMDFGSLKTGASKKVFIQVRGNSKAMITLSSENKGVMKHSINPKWYVDYTVNVDGETSSLESPMRVERPVAKNFRGSAYPMQVTIGDVTKSFSGKYSDIITIDVNPQ